ncbi:MAG: hypothetical protein JJ896_11840 [Rhodothermales bacterium]|nr:hypothetical protein [Rhodothermales bacterium]MBO6780336.1 hypothetical protein [Rhodothermales bacterium]
MRAWTALIAVLVSGCVLAGPEGSESLSVPDDLPAGFEPIPVPAHTPLTASRVSLGERLFFDPSLSADGSVSCASCHKPELAFADDVAVSPGVEGRTGIRNAPSLVNVAWQDLLFWDGGAFTLELQAVGPLEARDEMDRPLAEVLEQLNGDPSYREAFLDAFGDEATVQTFTQALGAYQRTIRSGGSRFDREALTPHEDAGRALFFGRANCASCHSGFLLTDQSFRSNGLSVAADSGRARITLRPEDRGLFKVPSLRNVSLTAPYMHDGRFESIEDVIEHYDKGGETASPGIRPLNLTAAEKRQLEAFLRALEDTSIRTGL